VVMASPGMLQSGLSRELFELWCSDPKNGTILPGYCVEGTLAKHIMSEPQTITTTSGLSLPLKMSVNYISFSAHSDFLQTSEFIDTLLPPNVVLVHGDANEMGRLKQSLVQKYENKNIQIFSPKNGQTVQLQFRAEKLAKTVGKLALKAPQDGDTLSGLVVVKDFGHSIMDPTDLGTFTQLSTSLLLQNITIPFHQNFDLVRETLEQLYLNVEIGKHPQSNKATLKVSEITITHSAHELVLEWNSDPVSDMIADSIIAMLSQLQVNPAKAHPRKTEVTLDHLHKHLKQEFEEVSINQGEGLLTITLDGTQCIIDFNTKVVHCEDPFLRERVENFVKRLDHVAYPLNC